MNMLTRISLVLASSILMLCMNAIADDGELVRKSMSKISGNPEQTPVPEAEHAFIDTMKLRTGAGIKW